MGRVMTSGTRVVLAHGHRLFRESMVRALYRCGELDIVGSEPSGADALTRCREASAHLLLTDWYLPDITGRRLVERVLRESAQTRVLIVGDERRLAPEEALRVGAWGFVAEQAGFPELLTAVRVVAAGELWASRE